MIIRGSRVKINKKGFDLYYKCDANPDNCSGTVLDYIPGLRFPFKVKWDNGESNEYQDGTLDLVEIKLENT